jgi:hypothetical protein
LAIQALLAAAGSWLAQKRMGAIGERLGHLGVHSDAELAADLKYQPDASGGVDGEFPFHIHETLLSMDEEPGQGLFRIDRCFF